MIAAEEAELSCSCSEDGKEQEENTEVDTAGGKRRRRGGKGEDGRKSFYPLLNSYCFAPKK